MQNFFYTQQQLNINDIAGEGRLRFYKLLHVSSFPKPFAGKTVIRNQNRQIAVHIIAPHLLLFSVIERNHYGK
jgi:hypothetical protein